MIELPRPVWGAVIVVGLGAAVWAGGNVTTAVPAAMLAVAGAAGLALQELWPRVRFSAVPPPTPVGDPLLALREAFRTGPLGRRTILATVASLRRQAAGSSVEPISLDEERRLVDAPQAEFLAWLQREVARLEAAT